MSLYIFNILLYYYICLCTTFLWPLRFDYWSSVSIRRIIYNFLNVCRTENRMGIRIGLTTEHTHTKQTLGDWYSSALRAHWLARSLRERKVPGSNPTVGKTFSFYNSRLALITGRVSPCKWSQPWHSSS